MRSPICCLASDDAISDEDLVTDGVLGGVVEEGGIRGVTRGGGVEEEGRAFGATGRGGDVIGEGDAPGATDRGGCGTATGDGAQADSSTTRTRHTTRNLLRTKSPDALFFAPFFDLMIYSKTRY